WVKWSSSDESVCRVDDDGLASVIGPGEGAVVAWYASTIAIARITVPYNREGEEPGTPGVSVDRRKPRNFIDEQIDAQLDRPHRPAAVQRPGVHPPRLRRHDRTAADGR